jgi:hypothetical protein
MKSEKIENKIFVARREAAKNKKNVAAKAATFFFISH